MSRPSMILPAKVDLRVLTSVSKFCGGDSARFYLAGVRVEIRPRDVIYIATCGKRLLALRREKLRDDPDNDMTGEFTIPVAQCRAFKLKADESGEADLYRDRDEDRLILQRGDVGVSFTPLEGGEFVGRWVDWRHVIPRFPLSSGTGQFDYSQLATFQKFADEMSAGIYPYVAHNGRDGGALIRFHHVDAIGVVMPVNIDDQRNAPLPDWADTYFDRYTASGPTSRKQQSQGDGQEDDIFSTLGDQAQAHVDSLQDRFAANTSSGDLDAEERTAPATEGAGDELAAGQQQDALAEAYGGTEFEALTEQEQLALSPEQQANVDQLSGIKPIDETADASSSDGPKKRRGRKSMEERVAGNAEATATAAEHRAE